MIEYSEIEEDMIVHTASFALVEHVTKAIDDCIRVKVSDRALGAVHDELWAAFNKAIFANPTMLSTAAAFFESEQTDEDERPLIVVAKLVGII